MGRFFFKHFGFFVAMLLWCLHWLPMFFLEFMFDLVKYFPGRAGCFVRYLFFASLVKECGDNVFIGDGVTVKNFGNISCGNNLSIHNGCYIDAAGGLRIGDDVSIAHQTSIITFNHTWDCVDVPIKYNKSNFLPVVIESDVWVGCGVRILPGVKVNSRSVIAAGAVVVSDVPSNTVMGGVPAKVLRRI